MPPRGGTGPRGFFTKTPLEEEEERLEAQGLAREKGPGRLWGLDRQTPVQYYPRRDFYPWQFVSCLGH